MHKPVNKYSQISFVKKVKPYAVIIDVHFAPAIGFTKALRFNELIPSIAVYGRELFSNAKAVKVGNNRFPILIKEDLLLYLLLHLFHHNFQGIHRMELIANVIGQDKPDMDIVLNRARRYGYEYIIYPSVLVFNKFFGGLSLPKEARIPLFMRLAGFYATRTSPFDTDTKAIEAGKKLIFSLVFSTLPLSKRLRVIFSKDALDYFFSTIKSTFLRS